MKPSAVLFDCDGVVVDSEGIAFSILGQELAEAGLPVDNAAMHRLFLGGTVAGLYTKALEMGADLPTDWVAGFYTRLYAKLGEGVPLIAGITTVLDRLRAAGVPFAMGSNGSDEKMQITLGQHPDVRVAFGAHIYSGQTLGKPKPAPDLYLHAARQLGVNPALAVVIEDSPTGARAARAAGMRCFGYAPQDGAALVAEGAFLFRDMADLPALLGI